MTRPVWILLAILLAPIALHGEEARPDRPDEQALEVSSADWSGFEKGVDLLAKGKPRRASRAFRRVDDPTIEALASIAEDLALAYWRDAEHEPYKVIPFLKEAIQASRIADVPEPVVRGGMEVARDRLPPDSGQAPLVRALLCHLKYLGGLRPEIEEEELTSPSDPSELPRRLFGLSPVYTSTDRKERTRGKVITKLVVDREGCVNDVEILEEVSEGLGSSVSATHQWGTLTPLEVDGEAVPYFFHTSVDFDIQTKRP